MPCDETLRVGVIDSSVAATTPALGASEDFSDSTGADRGGSLPRHGQCIVDAISENCPGISVYLASVFDDRLVCSASQVAAAIEWLCRQDVVMINMSFGLREDRDVLRKACAVALERGICLVAASPAQGAACFPANYPGVLRATGDARCKPGQISYLDSPQADFGGYPGDPQTGIAGASRGCASVSAVLARLHLEMRGACRSEILSELAQRADYRDIERRSEAVGLTNGACP